MSSGIAATAGAPRGDRVGPYLTALGLTLAFELPVYTGIGRRGLNVPTPHGLASAAIVNLLSHPLAFLVVMPMLAPGLGYFPALALVEVGVWVSEAALLWAWLRRDLDLVALAALLANVLSLSLGLLLVL